MTQADKSKSKAVAPKTTPKTTKVAKAPATPKPTTPTTIQIHVFFDQAICF